MHGFDSGRSEEFRERATSRRQSIHFFVTWDPPPAAARGGSASVHHQGPVASPVLLTRERTDSIHIGRRIAAGEDGPEEVVESRETNSLSSTITIPGKRLTASQPPKMSTEGFHGILPSSPPAA